MTTSSFANPFRPYNPFIATVEEQPLELDEVEETGAHVSYALVQNGPAVTADEVESHLDSVEVKVTWGTQVLSVSHLETGKGFSIGEGGDLVLPNASAKTELVGVRNGQWFVSIPTGATATVYNRGQSPMSVNAGNEMDVRDGMRLSIEVDGVTIDVAAVRAGKKLPVGFLASLATGAAAAIGLSFVGHTAIVAAMALFMPTMNANDAEAISRDQMLSMQTLLNASADREQERLKEEAATDGQPGGGSTGGEPTKGESGTAGTPTPKMAPGHMAFKGKDERSQFSRQDELTQIRTEGLIGMLRAGHSELGHTQPWGQEPMGMEAMNAHGAFFGSDIGEVAGSGYGLSGTGEGAGGKGEGVGIDGVGNTVGGGGGGPGKWGYGKGDKDGVGNGHQPLGGGHVAKAPPPPRPGTVTTNGHLPAEVIQRIVRQNFGRFRLCYEAGLRGNPTLQGRVVTKFVIGRDGAVSQSADGGSDLPNQEVTSCVVRAFQNLSFPTPESGIVTVQYPLTFTPGE